MLEQKRPGRRAQLLQEAQADVDARRALLPISVRDSEPNPLTDAMNLTTTYLGFKLRTPLVPRRRRSRKTWTTSSAWKTQAPRPSSFIRSLRNNCGANSMTCNIISTRDESYAEALTYFPEHADFRVGPEAYLENISAAKEAVDIPIIASLNGSTFGGWTKFAREIEQAGADALELNIYTVPTDRGARRRRH